MSYSDITERYTLIKPYLERYKRRFTVLDLGAFEGAFSFQIARDFPQAVVVAIEQDPIILEKAREANLPNVLVINRKISAGELKEISQCEHFDVTLALNVFHHFSADWDVAYWAVDAMSHRTIIQTPLPYDEGACGKEVTAHGFRTLSAGRCIGETVQFAGHMPRPIYVDERPMTSHLYQSGIGSPKNCIDAHIYSSDESKLIRLAHKAENWKPWTFGFNLANFCNLGGGSPDKATIIRKLREMPLPEKRHGDIVLHNIIFDGHQMQLIDGGDDWGVDDRENLEATIRKVEEMLP